MKLLLGGPGTLSGLLLRFGQCAFGVSSFALMHTALAVSSRAHSSDAHPFRLLASSMGILVLWSFVQACFDIYALRTKRELRESIDLPMFVIIDLLLATLSLAYACSSAGVVFLFTRDLDYCIIHKRVPCNYMCQISVAMAFISWILTAISSHVMFWILVSV